MKYSTFFALFVFLLAFNFSNAQIERINETVTRLDAESHVRFLASDEMKGRNTGSSELNAAGRYIAEQFRKSGLIPLGDSEGDYLQKVYLSNSVPPNHATAKVLGKSYTIASNLAMLKGSNKKVEGPAVFIKDKTSYDEDRVKGKIVIMILGDPRQGITQDETIKFAEEGVVGLIGIYGPGQQFPWKLVANYLNQPRMSVEKQEADEVSIPYVWIHDTATALINELKESSGFEAEIEISGLNKQEVNTFNVVGKIEGTDAELKKEHLIMCAHYDHVGIKAGEEGADSIYNGTRDNAIGTTGLINAAHYFGKYPPKRSVIVIALTGEEKGLLGSNYYTNNPKIPLDECVFTLNIDNSGYTTTDVITLLDTGRTNIDALVYEAAADVGLGVIGDRLPSQNYYERSDQVSFATKGVPAVNFKMSMTAFDDRISKYYHQPSDEVNNVDLDYVYKYWRAYIRSAELIANWSKLPYWIEGDKFEPAGEKLYNK